MNASVNAAGHERVCLGMIDCVDRGSFDSAQACMCSVHGRKGNMFGCVDSTVVCVYTYLT